MTPFQLVKDRITVFLGCAAFVWLSASAVASAGDWPQWGGPRRTFKADCKNLASKWPEDGPRKLWDIELGDGYSAIIRDGDTLFTMYSVRKQIGEQKWEAEGQEAVVALDAATGAKKWEFKYDAPWEKDMNMEFGPGPHSTPLVVGDRLFAVGCTCKLHCLDKTSGKVLWSKDLHKEFEASTLGRGYGASPLAYKDTIILPVGGVGRGVIALRQSDGGVVWKNQNSSGTYASPMLVTIDGVEQIITFADNGVSGLNPGDGSLLWNAPHKTQYDANISTPVLCRDNIVFCSSAYGNGARGIEVKKEGDAWTARELWYNPKMKIHHGNAVSIGRHVYGSSGDFGPAFFASVDIRTGEFGFKKRGFSKATCVYADKKLIILDEDGNLALAKVSPKKLKVLSKAQVCRKIAWTVPTLVDGVLYLRDRHRVLALDISEGAEQAALR